MNWRQGQIAILTQQYFFDILARLLNRGSLRALRPSVCKLVFTLRHPVSNCLKPPRIPGYIIVSRLSASAVLPLIYTGASLDWRFGRESYITGAGSFPLIFFLCDNETGAYRVERSLQIFLAMFNSQRRLTELVVSKIVSESVTENFHRWWNWYWPMCWYDDSFPVHGGKFRWPTT